MSITNSYTEADAHTQANGRRWITHYFTAHTGEVEKRGPKKVPGAWTETEYAAERTALEPQILSRLADKEIQQAISDAERNITNTPKIPIARLPEHQTQVEFDRRLLGRTMQIFDLEVFVEFYTWFQGTIEAYGPNAVQRAANLGVQLADYSLIENKYNEIAAIRVQVANQRTQIWDDLPAEFL